MAAINYGSAGDQFSGGSGAVNKWELGEDVFWNTPPTDPQQLAYYRKLQQMTPEQRVAETGFDPSMPNFGRENWTPQQQATYDQQLQTRMEQSGQWVNPDKVVASQWESEAAGWHNRAYDTEMAGWDQIGANNADLRNWSTNTQIANQAEMGNIYNQLAWQDQQNVNYINQSQGIVDQLGGLTNNANNFDWANTAGYWNSLDQSTALNNQALAGYGQAYQQFSPQLQSGVSWQGDLTSQAAQAYADPAAIQAQWQALGQLQGAANGSLDQQSQAAYAQADVNAINGQMAMANQLSYLGSSASDIRATDLDGYYELTAYMNGYRDVDLSGSEGYQALRAYMNGANYVDPSSIKGYDDLYDVYGGSLDAEVGEADPEAYAALVDARNQYKNLTTPEVTAAERSIYEQARMKQEQDERGMRAAAATEARMRGVGGGGNEVVRSMMGAQQASQNRLLSDLGAQANAVERSMMALGGYADVSSAMTAQADALAESNMNRRLGALGQYADLGYNVMEGNENRRFNATGQVAGMDMTNMTNNANRRYDATNQVVGLNNNIAQFNQQRQVNASNAAAGVYSTARGQSFNESYSRGIAADNMANANADRRLGAMNYSGQLASNMRDSSFNEAFSRGTAADQTAQFNRMGSLRVDEFNANYRQSERDSAWARTSDYANFQQNTATNNAILAGNKYTSGQTTNANTFARSSGVLGAQQGVYNTTNQLAQQQTNARIGAAGAQMNLNNQYYTNLTGLNALDNQTVAGRTGSTVNHYTTIAGLAGANAEHAWAKAGIKDAPGSEQDDFMNGTGKYG